MQLHASAVWVLLIESTNQPNIKSNPNPTSKQHTVVTIQLNNYCHVSYVSSDIYASRCNCTVFTSFHTAEIQLLHITR